jgi:hypothetical protein
MANIHNQNRDFPHYNVTGKESDVQPEGRPGSEAGADWESAEPNIRVIEEHLEGLDYPFQTVDLIQHMRFQKAPVQTVRFLEQLPDREFQSWQEIDEALRTIR